MKKAIVSMSCLLALCNFAWGQQIPPIRQTPYEATGASSLDLPPIRQVSSNPSVTLDAKARQAVRLAGQWMNAPNMPVLGADGSVTFIYGSTLPQLICKPLFACDVTLQAGERIKQVDVGDAVRWQVKPSVSGTGTALTTHLIIKPSEADLNSNMVVTTDRRIYNIQLISKVDDWMPSVSFYYPEDNQTQWASYYEKQEPRNQGQRKLTPIEQQPEIAKNLPQYKLSGDKPSWRPVKVYADDQKTYIKFPASVKNDETPVLVVLGPDHNEQLVNYRMIDDSYVVDKVVSHAALISGVGRHQQKVEIVREGK